MFGRFGYAVSDTARLDLMVNRFQLKGEGDYVSANGDYTRNLPTTSVRGTPPGVPATNRTESAALTYTDTALWGGNLMLQGFLNRSRDTYGGEIAPIATFQDAAIARWEPCSTSPRTAAANLAASSPTNARCPAWRR